MPVPSCFQPPVSPRFAPLPSGNVQEKYQRILKECQKRPENRSCFDCSGRGNQYVVLNFNTFVCTTCSGIHREMQHKIKSVGMSTFTTDEIKLVDKGGNAIAKATWMARYTPGDGAIPAEGDADKIRAFLKQKCATHYRTAAHIFRTKMRSCAAAFCRAAFVARGLRAHASVLPAPCASLPHAAPSPLARLLFSSPRARAGTSRSGGTRTPRRRRRSRCSPFPRCLAATHRSSS